MNSNYDALAGGVSAFGGLGRNFGRLGGSFGSLGGAGVRFTGSPFALSSAAPAADGQCWFHEPRALASSGKVWFGTNGSNDNTQTTGRATLFEVNEATGSITKKDLATGAFWGDDHCYPVVLIRPDGRLIVFYCAHRQLDPIRYRISVSVGTMAGGWSQEYTISSTTATQPTYPSPVMLSAESNKVYLFFRDGVAASLAYLTSADIATVSPASVDGGALGATPTWSAENTLTISSGAQGIYAKIRNDGVDRIDILITDAVSGTSGTKNDIRHGYCTGGKWYTSLGAALGTLPVTFTSFSAVATSGAPDSFGDVWVWDIQHRPVTNLVTNQSAFGSWTSAFNTIQSDVAANPIDGATTADRMTDSGGSPQVHSLQFPASVSVVTGRVYKFSVLVKYETAQFLQLLLPNGAFGSTAYANFDIQNGTIGTVGATATASIEPGNLAGWYRIAIRATATGTAAAVGGIYGCSLSTSVRAESYLSTGLTRLLYQAIVEEEIIEALFARFASVSDHRYYYARWNGLTWAKSEIDAGLGGGTPDTRSSQITDGNGAAEAYYSPGLYFDTAQTGVVYCAIGYSTYSLVYRYTTANAGSSWSRVRVSGQLKENVRPFVPVGRTSLYSIFWASGDYHFYDFAGTNDPSYGYTTRINVASLAYSAVGAAPSNTAVPTIAGTAQVGNVLTSTTGTWTGDLPIAYTYQWLSDGSSIPAATASSYTIVSGDVGHAISLRVTGTNSFGNASAASASASALPSNMVVHSEAFDLWNGSGTSGSGITTNVAAEPINSQTTADRVTETLLASSGTSHNTNSVAISFLNATAYTFSVCAKFENRQFLQLLFGSGAFGVQAYANFDIQNGTVQAVGSSASASITSLGGGWYRLIVTATSTSAASTVAGIYGIDASNAARAQQYIAGTAHTWLLADAQVEPGSNANTYVPVA